jgi:hypothetical protein
MRESERRKERRKRKKSEYEKNEGVRRSVM